MPEKDTITAALRMIGLSPEEVDPDVLAALRAAQDNSRTSQATAALEAAFQDAATPITIHQQESDRA